MHHYFTFDKYNGSHRIYYPYIPHRHTTFTPNFKKTNGNFKKIDCNGGNTQKLCRKMKETVLA